MTGGARAGLIALVSVVSLPGVVRAEGATAPAPDVTPVRVSYTTSVFRDVAESDARAAIKAWTENIARERAIRTYAEAGVVPDAESLARLCESGRVDFGGTTTPEFLQVEKRLGAEPLFAPSRGGSAAVEYLLLVRRDSAFNRLSDVRDADLMTYDNPRASLALPWLEVLLSEQGLGAAGDFFGRIEPATKLSAVVLPVFFGRARACLVTQDGFQTMAELNPQVGRELRVMARSVVLVPMVSFLRRDFTPPFRQSLITSLATLHEGASGRQVLNLVQADAVVLLGPGALDSARELLSRWQRRGMKADARLRPARAGAAVAHAGEK